MYTGSDNILDAFDSLRNGNPYFSIWCDRDILFQFNEVDLQKGRKALEDILLAADSSGNTDILLIKFHPKLEKGGYITNATPVISTLPVRVVEMESNVRVQRDGNAVGGMMDEYRLPAPVYNMMKVTTQALTDNAAVNAKLLERVEALENGSTNKEPDTWDRISGIMEKPGAMELIAGILSRFLPGAQPNIQIAGTPGNIAQKSGNGSNIAEKSDYGHADKVPANIADISDAPAFLTDEQNDAIDTALDRLSSHCNIVEALPQLADYADANPDMFKLLLGNLKTA
jgi:hypothetical protein